MSIHKFSFAILLSISALLCSQSQAQDGSGSAATPGTPTAEQTTPAASSESALRDKLGMLMGYRSARNWKSQNPNANYAQILAGIKDAESGVDKDNKSSYMFGYQMMSQMMKEKAGITAAQLEVGLQKAMSGQELGMNEQEIRMLGMQFQQMMEQRRIAEMKMTVEKNKSEGMAYIEAQKKAIPGMKELSDGIYYEVLKEGSGQKPGANATVLVDYTGTFPNGEVFDSSVKPLDGGPGEPAKFKVGKVIPGFTKSLLGMNVGSKWRVIIPGDQAYGVRGSGGRIGPMQTLVFELELLEILDTGESPAATAAPGSDKKAMPAMESKK